MSASYEGGGYRLQVPLKAVQPFYEARVWSSEELGKGYAFTFQGEEVITVSNRGDLTIAPITQFTGQIHSIRLSLNQQEWAIHLPFTVEQIIIDHERMTVTDGNGRNLFPYFRGHFLKLAPGENHLTVTGGDSELHLYVKMKARYWF